MSKYNKATNPNVAQVAVPAGGGNNIDRGMRFVILYSSERVRHLSVVIVATNALVKTSAKMARTSE